MRSRTSPTGPGPGGLVARLEAGYCEETPGGGIHWLMRCREVAGNTRLAARPGPPDDEGRPTIDVLIETRGEGGYIVLAPSHGPVHPSGRPYRLRSGSFATIPTVEPKERAELWELARPLDEMPRPEPREPRPAAPGAGDGPRPGADFNARTSWEEVLAPHGWVAVFTQDGVTYWRPGKERGISATTNYGDSDLLYVFSTSTDLPANRGHSKFGAFALLEHGGDFAAAARALAARGFGARPANNGTPGPPDAGGPDWPPLKLELMPATTPFPTEVFPPPLRDYCLEAAAALQVPADFVGVAMLAVAGAAIGQSVKLRLKADWEEPALLNVIQVVRPGRGKSPANRAVTRPLVEIDRRLRRESDEARAAWEEVRRRHDRDPDNNPPPGPGPSGATPGRTGRCCT